MNSRESVKIVPMESEESKAWMQRESQWGRSDNNWARVAARDLNLRMSCWRSGWAGDICLSTQIADEPISLTSMNQALRSFFILCTPDADTWVRKEITCFTFQ
jgi:hypothetical protein